MASFMELETTNMTVLSVDRGSDCRSPYCAGKLIWSGHYTEMLLRIFPMCINIAQEDKKHKFKMHQNKPSLFFFAIYILADLVR